MKNLIIIAGYDRKEYKIDINTGFINGSENWIFKGLSHVKMNYFIPLKMITEDYLESMERDGFLFYKNGNCQFTVRDLDHGGMREWGNRPEFIYFREIKETIAL